SGAYWNPTAVRGGLRGWLHAVMPHTEVSHVLRPAASFEPPGHRSARVPRWPAGAGRPLRGAASRGAGGPRRGAFPRGRAGPGPVASRPLRGRRLHRALGLLPDAAGGTRPIRAPPRRDARLLWPACPADPAPVLRHAGALLGPDRAGP